MTSFCQILPAVPVLRFSISVTAASATASLKF